jgi:hypothetical protein
VIMKNSSWYPTYITGGMRQLEICTAAERKRERETTRVTVTMAVSAKK